MNATHLFDQADTHHGWLPFSASFWTTIFAFFVLHLAREKNSALAVWEPTGSLEAVFLPPEIRS